MEVSDAAAVARARAGEQEAFQALVERHSRNVFQLAFRMTGNEEDAEDVVQETFLKAFRNLSRFRGDSAFSTWLHRVTANCAVDLLRRRSRGEDPRPVEELDPPSESSDSPDRAALSGELGRRVTESLGRLSPMERMAFVLRHFEGRPIAEIARTLGLRGGATKNCVFRAVTKLRRELAPFLEASR